MKTYRDQLAIEEQQERAIKFLRELPHHRLLELQEAIELASNAARETSKTAKIAIAISIEPLDADGTMAIQCVIDTKLPKVPKPDAIFFAAPSGALSREDSRQEKMMLEQSVKSHSDIVQLQPKARPS